MNHYTLNDNIGRLQVFEGF